MYTKSNIVARGSTKTIAKTINILFTCAGRRVELLRCFRDAMKTLDLQGNFVTTDITTTSPASHFADAAEIVPRAGQIEYIPRLLDIVKKHEIQLVVPLTDLDLRSLSRQRDRFSDIGCTVMVGSQDSIMLCRDKTRTNQQVIKAGLSGIKTVTLETFKKKPFFPCFIKPIRGSASIGASLIRDKRELKAHLSTYGEMMLVQEYAPGQEFTVDVYRSRDGQVRSVVPRQRLIVRSGEVEKGVTRNEENLIQDTVKLAEQMGDLWGVFCCQCRYQPGGHPRFFEINPRFGGGSPLAIAAGANFPLYLLQEVLDMEITAKLGDFTDKLMMLRYDSSVFTQADHLEELPGFDAPIMR